MLKFENVRFSYPDAKETIHDLSFHIQKGEMVSMIGTNGAGKSTISRLANGLLIPQEGHVYVDGADTRTTRTSQIAHRIGFLFQNPSRQICQNTVREEIEFGPRVQGVPEDEIRQRTEEALETFSLKGEWFPFNRSRGELQRIALASVLACKPEIVILDEPTTGLDYRECVVIMDYIRKMNREQKLTVLMVSHDMEIVQDYAERVLVLTGGRLIGDGPVNTIMKDLPLLKEANVIPAQIPQLALRLGAGFEDIYFASEMADALIARRKETKV